MQAGNCSSDLTQELPYATGAALKTNKQKTTRVILDYYYFFFMILFIFIVFLFISHLQ